MLRMTPQADGPFPIVGYWYQRGTERTIAAVVRRP